jgi:hypothetical protein
MCPTPQRLLGFASGQRIQRALNLFYLPARQQTLTQNPNCFFHAIAKVLFGQLRSFRFRNFETCVNLHEFTVGILESQQRWNENGGWLSPVVSRTP